MTGYKERAAEAARLAPHAGESTVDSRLLALLLDPEDTAVSQAAADGLLARRDELGVRLFARAFGLAPEDTRNKLGDCLYDDDGTLWGTVLDLLPQLTEHESDEVRNGAAALADHMHEQQQRDRR